MTYSLFHLLYIIFRIETKIIISVYADGLIKRAKKEMVENFEVTGFYETNVERTERESKQK